MLGMHFEKLQVWQKARELARAIYKMTSKFPKEEMYGMCSQMRRAAISIASNIAEGSQRGTDKDFAHFLLIAKGSLAELETQCILAADFSYLSEKELIKTRKDVEELSRMLYSFHSKLKA